MEENDNVIKGPWKRALTVTPEENDRVREQVEFVEDLAENVVVNAISIFSENGFETDSQNMRMYISFLNEAVRSLAYKEFGYKHPLNPLVEKLMTEKKVDNSLDVSYYGINFEKVKELTED